MSAGGRVDPAAVRFLLDERLVEIDAADPTRTVLQWLREDERRTGTKEGCAEGDCGACTVALAEPAAEGRGLRVRAVNACIAFLPALDGKALLTVESLRGAPGRLHPVAEALVEHHGSQCGFCTPGFVMSLFALYKAGPRPSPREVDEALAGNLCRCTGYRPIVDAALAMHALGERQRAAARHWSTVPGGGGPGPGEAELAERLRALARPGTLDLRRGARRAFAPRSLEALAALVERHPEAVLVAGGTDVALRVTKQHRDLDLTIHVAGVAELRRVEESRGGLEIGAAATLAELHGPLVGRFPELDELLRRFASPPVRNVATLGGNVANGSPIGDTMPALMALGASLVLRRGRRTREVPLDSFYRGYRESALRPGELLERIRIPARPPGLVLRAYKVSKRFDQDISAVGAGIAFVLEAGRISRARVAFAGLAETVRRAPGCEAALEGRPWSEATARSAMAALAGDFDPIDDLRASAAYRRTVAGNLIRRCFLETGSASPPATRVREVCAVRVPEGGA